MGRRFKKYSQYQYSLLNKYEIDESYLQTAKQRRQCFYLLEKIDENKKVDEKDLLNSVIGAFKGTKFHKKLASCLSVAALITALQTTPVMANAISLYKSKTEISQIFNQTVENNYILLDDDSFSNTDFAFKAIKKLNTSIHLIPNTSIQNKFYPIFEQTVMLDDDSDVHYPNDNSLTVIDTAIEDWKTLKDSVKGREILLLDSTDNPLDEILLRLEKMGKADSLNIISHGSSGRLEFENGAISIETLEKNKEKWKKIGSLLNEDGDIQLLGCNIAKGTKGKTFIKRLADITGSDVAASINPTGSAEKGGDWKLESIIGNVAEKDFQLKNLYMGLLDVNGATMTFYEVGEGPYPAYGQVTIDTTPGVIDYTYGGATYNFEANQYIYNGMGSSAMDERYADLGWQITGGNFGQFTSASLNLGLSYMKDVDGNLKSDAYLPTLTWTANTITWSGIGPLAWDFRLYLVVDFTSTAIPSNTAPVVDLNGVGVGIDESRSFTEDAGAVTIAPSATVTDAEGDEIQTITITLTNDQDGAAEALYLGSATNVNIAGSGTDTLTLSDTGSTTNAQFQTALRAITYNNTSDTPNTTDRSITVVANDGTDNSATATVTMSVAANNDLPTDISLTSSDVDEEQPSGTVVGTLSTTDPDN
jgi:Domain of unknown function (DUF4347)